jgi:hypothetical protein
MEEPKGFKVDDKRRILKEEQPQEKKEEPKEKKEKQQTPTEKVLPPVTFSSFIVSLSSSALIHMGEISDPITGNYQKNLLLAKQTIEILELLKEKTRANLDKEEEGILNNILFDIRLRYVKQTGR